MGDAAADLADLPLRLVGVGDLERVGQVVPHVGGDPVRGPAGDLVHRVADVEELPTAALEVGVRDVDEPGGHERGEDRGVAEPAAGLLEVGHRGVRELAEPLAAPLRHLPQLGQPLPRVAAPLGQDRGAQLQG